MEEFLKFGRFEREQVKILGGPWPSPAPPCRRPWACMQNILIFLVIFRAKCLIFWPFTKTLDNNRRITEKKPRLIIVLI